MKTYHFIVVGRVQGVGYRFFTHTEAKKYNLKGSVKNLDNGSVEIFVQGKDENINFFKKKLSLGTSFSKVDKIIESLEDMEEFEIFQMDY